MKHLSYKNQNHHNQLFVENIAIADIAAKVGTPFYCYSKQTLVENFQSFVDAFSHAEITDYKICYAIKANFTDSGTWKITVNVRKDGLDVKQELSLEIK